MRRPPAALPPPLLPPLPPPIPPGLAAAALPLVLATALGGCGAAPAGLQGSAVHNLPLPPGIRVAFNHRGESRYRSPISGRWRQGDDLEALLLETIAAARHELLVAVQELSLPRVAEALVAAQQRGVRVQVVLENTYATPWSELTPMSLPPHQRRRVEQLRALGQGDAVAILQRGAIPMLDDTADGSRGSGLMHHKFLVADGQVLVTGSANFSPSCIHGDADDPRSRGNVNHLLRFESAALATLFRREFERMWGDGPGGAPDSRFGLAKDSGPPARVRIGDTTVEVLFSPHRRRDPHHGLAWLETQLAGVRQRIDLSLFVFSGQNLADALAQLRQQGVHIRLLADPGFAHRAFSEVLDLLAMELPDHRCRLEAGNRPWGEALEGVGTPQLAGGDKLHHKFAVLDRKRVISGSFNWSPSAAHQNDETLLRIDSPLLARHFEAEMDRLWRGAELGVTERIQRKRTRLGKRCGRWPERPRGTGKNYALSAMGTPGDVAGPSQR